MEVFRRYAFLGAQLPDFARGEQEGGQDALLGIGSRRKPPVNFRQVADDLL